MRIDRFEEIEGWQIARQLTKRIYQMARESEMKRDFALRDQMTRVSGSIMHNIAEGFDGGSNAEFSRFLQYAKRSCSELQSQLYIALDQKYCTQETFDELYEDARLARSKIGAFIKYLNKTKAP